jgi:predicted  nucleic acid-binding Zn-ribbon protein
MEIDSRKLAKLRHLSDIDGQLYALEDEKKERPEKLKKEQKELQTLLGEEQKIEERIRSITLTIKQKELELTELEEKIRKQEHRLDTIKSNKEYAAIRLEIANYKAAGELLEEDILKKMEEVEQIKEEKNQLKQQSDKVQEKLKLKEERIQMALKHLEEQITTLSQDRLKAKEGIPSTLYEFYERLLKYTKGSPLAESKNTVCQRCFCSCTSQDVNRLLLQREIVTCKTCSRILYLNLAETFSE